MELFYAGWPDLCVQRCGRGRRSQPFPSCKSLFAFVSNHPTRYYDAHELHFINCSCYHRQPGLKSQCESISGRGDDGNPDARCMS